MQSKEHPRQRDREANSGDGAPSRRRRDFGLRRRVPQKPVSESTRARASTSPPLRPHRLRGYLLVDVQLQPSRTKNNVCGFTKAKTLGPLLSRLMLIALVKV